MAAMARRGTVMVSVRVLGGISRGEVGIDVGVGVCSEVGAGVGVAVAAGVSVAVIAEVGGVVRTSELMASEDGVVVSFPSAAASAGVVMVDSTPSVAGNVGEAPPHPASAHTQRTRPNMDHRFMPQFYQTR